MCARGIGVSALKDGRPLAREDNGTRGKNDECDGRGGRIGADVPSFGRLDARL